MIFNRTKSIRHYFPDIVIARDMLKRGVEKYSNHKKYTLVDADDALCNGKLYFEGHPIAYKDEHGGKLYVSPGLAAVMYATGKEPRWYDLNTPCNTYHWSFDKTRDLINALDALYNGNPFYWNQMYGQERRVSVLGKTPFNYFKRLWI
jgi:hypothetical protein